jgi:3-phenylpropionate/cinnamic acid dioxygenase small subunit
MKGSMDEQSDQRRHVVTNVFFETEGDRNATVVSYVTITSVENGAIRLVTTGLYRDEVASEDGNWRICGRRIELDMAY